MSLLKQSIAQRRASEPAEMACVRIGAQTPGLVVALWTDESWVLPWTYLLSAHYTCHEGDDQLVLSFTTQVVTSDGQNLAPVIEAVAGFRLGLLRELPPECRARVSGNAPFISRIKMLPVVATSPARQTS